MEEVFTFMDPLVPENATTPEQSATVANFFEPTVVMPEEVVASVSANTNASASTDHTTLNPNYVQLITVTKISPLEIILIRLINKNDNINSHKLQSQ